MKLQITKDIDMKSILKEAKLSKYRLAVESGVGYNHIVSVLNEERPMTQKAWKKILPVLKKRGIKI